MFKKLRIIIWSIVAELEYILYPWKCGESPPPEFIQKYNLYDSHFDENFNYDWLKINDEKISRLQNEMLYVKKAIDEIKNGQK